MSGSSPVNPSDDAGRPVGATQAPLRKSILIVDDNRDSGEMLAELLEVWGHDPKYVESGEEALQAIVQKVPDVVILDLGLPVMDGYEVAQRIRSLPASKHIRIIALSGYGQEEHRRKSREAGCQEHLVKPVNMQLLERALGA